MRVLGKEGDHMLVTRFEMRGTFECFLRDPDGAERHVGTYENLFTNNAKERALRTLLQTTSGDKLSATAYPAKLAFCTGTFPLTPQSDDIDADGGGIADDPNGYVSFNTLANITSSSSSCSGTKSATWTNSSGGSITVTFLACVYSNSKVASNVYNMANIEDTDVLNGQSFVVNYNWQFNFDTSEEAI